MQNKANRPPSSNRLTPSTSTAKTQALKSVTQMQPSTSITPKLTNSLASRNSSNLMNQVLQQDSYSNYNPLSYSVGSAQLTVGKYVMNNQNNYQSLKLSPNDQPVGDLRARNQMQQQQSIMNPIDMIDLSMGKDQYVDYKQPIKSSSKGVVGFRNIGNTCFMNSVLQCLMNTPGFNDTFINDSYRNQLKKQNGVASEYAKLVQRYRNSPNFSSETPSELKRAIEKVCPQFNGYDQQDAQELMLQLLEGINQDTNRITTQPKYQEMNDDLTNKSLQKLSDEWWKYQKSRENSIVQDYFTGQLLNKVICNTCQNSAYAFDNFSDISLSLSRSMSMLDDMALERLIEQFLKEEVIDDFYCKCWGDPFQSKGAKKSKRQFIIWRLPQILVLHFKRFNFRRFSSDKLNQKISFPIRNLNLQKFSNESNDSSTKDCIYDLFGIVNHSGSLSGGHYTADCQSAMDNEWYKFNDSQVTAINIDKQMYNQGGSASPYILFYCRKNK